MSLIILKSEEDAIKAGYDFVINNSWFFNHKTALKDCDFVRSVLSKIDNASYAGAKVFKSRSGDILSSDCLSTGAKVLLNIFSHPDKCFSIIECGGNALEMLPLIKDGCIMWSCPIMSKRYSEICDVQYNGKHFDTVEDLKLEVLREE